MPPLLPSHIRVIILEDDFFSRDALAARLERDAEISVVDETATPGEVYRFLKKQSISPDLLLADLDFPDPAIQPVQLLDELNTAYPRLKVLCLTLNPTPELLHQAILAGVDGILHKNECADALGIAVESCLQGDFVLTPATARALELSASPEESHSMAQAIGSRRWCILNGIPLPPGMGMQLQRVAYLRYVRGLTPDQVAEELTLSRLTVNDYLKQIKLILQIAGRRSLPTQGFMTITHLRWQNPT